MKPVLTTFAALLITAALPGQDQDASSRPSAESRGAETRPAEPAELLLAEVDARLYSARRAGLKSLAFSYVVRPEGDQGPEFRLRTTWSEKDGVAHRFLDKDRRPLAPDEEPAALALPASMGDRKTLRDRFIEGAVVHLGFFLGRPYSETYAGCRTRVERKTVNGREEILLVFEPVNAARFRRTEMTLGQDGLPRIIVRRLARPEHGTDAVVFHPIFGEVAGRTVLKSVQEKVAGRTDALNFEYQKVGGFILPASTERLVAGSKEAGLKTVYDDVVVDV